MKLVAASHHRGPQFNSRPMNVGFVADKMAEEHVFLRVL
jgi:hypothetical protein